MLKKEKPDFLNKSQDGGPTISQYEEPAWYEKAADYLASPMTALGYTARNQDLPESIPINAENRNMFDMIIDSVNPFAWAKYAASADRNLEKGEYLDAGFDALGAIPIVPAWLAKGKTVAKNLPVDKVKNFKFKTLPGIESKQLIKVVDGQFSEIDYQHLIPTADEISDIAKRTRERLLTDKFIQNNMKISYAIPVCNEHKELERLLDFLELNLRKEDEVVVQCDKGNTTSEVYKVINIFCR
mgnify:CR=1 FL=1